MNRSRSLLPTFGVLILVLGAVQLVPYGRHHTNPPDGTQAAFDSPRTRALAERACYDCHSNHTQWPWYASLAPISWRIQHHVDEGREKLNFTAFDAGNEKMADAAGEASESITKGDMPPADYLLLHPEARLSASEKAALAKGLDVTFAAFAEKGEGGGKGEAGEKGEKAEAGETGEKGADRD
ncbi:MAG TPA: heme-binding domain-containing protein [Verrucomicrobiae bacterium]|nr:heme-binding domain-containing protein [Verrucomicrobiae bacterium]